MVSPKKPRSKRTVLTTVDDVVDKLGGLEGVWRITGVKSTSVICNWIAEQQFPARYYKVMHDALARRRCTASHTLWDQRGNHLSDVGLGAEAA